jgi:hypothetical protein
MYGHILITSEFHDTGMHKPESWASPNSGAIKFHTVPYLMLP